jgi:hypothetical protein
MSQRSSTASTEEETLLLNFEAVQAGGSIEG